MQTISSRDFNRDVSAAKRAAGDGPVFITDRGEPAFVLLTVQEYRRREGSGASLVTRLSMPDDIEIEFEPADLHAQIPEL
ncbi:type II toxin-antitoxin system Phd/YefM family antitoxin [Demequina sp.]|uniref:type II toxin-antitoxin system Phd/YefM family antitoxin n=1 Tax=Demequina sp. TaxID=2050685 RepID=UPI003D0FA844